MILTRCRCQLLDVARGLAYLHKYNLVHGSLKGVSLHFFVRDEGG